RTKERFASCSTAPSSERVASVLSGLPFKLLFPSHLSNSDVPETLRILPSRMRKRHASCLSFVRLDGCNLPIAKTQSVCLKTLQQCSTRPFASGRVVCCSCPLDGGA